MDLSKFKKQENFLRTQDVQQPIVVTISGVEERQFPGESNPKLILNFEQSVKSLSCNSTNVDQLIKLFNVSDARQLVGKTIEIYVDPTVKYNGQTVGGLRLRLPQHPQQAAPLPPSPYQSPHQAQPNPYIAATNPSQQGAPQQSPPPWQQPPGNNWSV